MPNSRRRPNDPRYSAIGPGSGSGRISTYSEALNREKRLPRRGSLNSIVADAHRQIVFYIYNVCSDHPAGTRDSQANYYRSGEAYSIVSRGRPEHADCFHSVFLRYSHGPGDRTSTKSATVTANYLFPLILLLFTFSFRFQCVSMRIVNCN